MVFVREHVEHPRNFTVGLRYRTHEDHSYRLVRCNGLPPGGHVNHLEGERFGTSFHVHRATARYQEAGYDIDGYTEQSDAFRTLPQAISHLADLASILAPPGETEPML